MDILTVLRVVASLAVVLAVVWGAQKYLTRHTRPRSGADAVRVVSRQGLSPKAAVVVVDASGKRLVLGVTEQQVSVLHVTDAPEPELEPEPDQGFDEAMQRAGAGTAEPSTHSIFAPATWRQAAAALKAGTRK